MVAVERRIVPRDAPPAFRSTDTPSTPSIADNSSVTLDTQCEQVIPVTSTSAVTAAVAASAVSGVDAVAQQAQPAPVSFKPRSLRFSVFIIVSSS